MYLGNYLCNAENFPKACCCFEFAEIYRRIFFIIRNQAFFAVFFYVNTAIKKKNTYFALANAGAGLHQDNIAIMVNIFHTVAGHRYRIISLLSFGCVPDSKRFSNGFIKKQTSSGACRIVVVS